MLNSAEGVNKIIYPNSDHSNNFGEFGFQIFGQIWIFEYRQMTSLPRFMTVK